MNEGKLLKQMYSSEPHVEKLIEDAVKAWPYGYCEYVKSSNLQQSDDNCLIEVFAQNDDESTTCLIEAYMHLFCGFSLICCDFGDMKSSMGNCNIFRSITVDNVSSENVNDIQDRLAERVSFYKESGLIVKGAFLTAVGREISFDDFALYLSVTEKLDISTCFNTCLFEDEKSTYLQIYLALEEITYEDDSK